ncbi:amidohydrolase family protein [Halococcus thailandensis]|uniref:Amidohydrolase n=1 Tax=Halococcus thailandensis JCM 13552 TaxID=1227457 RepID=M0N170_9EURY|nr:amidohydrolase family protein [Halococcus thailandensis]EMA51586.1 amidohydrolase [Halococcus thailandensis JCM 13552]
MDSSPTLVVRNALLSGNDTTVDIAVDDGRIAAIRPAIETGGETELDAEGNLVSPGLVDAHVHLDMAFSASGDRRPRYNEGGADREETIERTATYFVEADHDELVANARRAADQAIANGVLHLRTHAYVDGTVGTDAVEAITTVREAVGDRLDIEIVAFPQYGIRRDDGSAEAVRAALDTGADLVGGLDPATLNGDREETIATWFEIATDHDADLDVHIHERGATGMRTLRHLAEATIEHDYENRVTASHAYALGDAASEQAPEWQGRLGDAMETFAAAELDFITCYQSTPRGMPIRRFHDAGLTMAHGTDQIHDLWGAHGNVDALEAMLVESLTLDGYSTNQGLRSLWNLITEQGGTVLDLDDYALAEGAPANLVVHHDPSPEWAITTNRTPRYVVSASEIVASDGTRQ